MACSALLPLSFILFTLTSKVVSSQYQEANNIIDKLDELECKQFKSIILEAGLENRFKRGGPATLFAFNDATYKATNPSRYGKLYEDTIRGAKDYVQSFTLDFVLETSSFSDAMSYSSEYNNRGYLFLNKKRLLSGNVASGTPGRTRYFVNGAMIETANIKAGSDQIIHLIDRVLDQPLPNNAISYADYGNPTQIKFLFYEKLMELLSETLAGESDINYSKQVRRPLQAGQVTFFLPTDTAIRRIPVQKLDELIGNTQKLLEVITLHIVPGKVLYTSLVNHNELFPTQMNSGTIMFRKNFEKEAVYVTGSRRRETVTAQIAPANITVYNGVVHQIDQLLGFVYKTAREEIETDTDTNNFERFVNLARKDLQNALSASSGVTVFVPTNNAILAIKNVYTNYISNISLINRVVALSMLQEDEHPFALTAQNSGYRSMIPKTSRYNRRMIRIYSEGNDTWVEGGYVRARVIKPDIGVTNGFVHQIDAVFGVPTRDIVYTIFCNDWLMRTYDQMKYVKLDKYMRDSKLIANQQCSFRSGEISSPAGVVNKFSPDICGDEYYRCQFTFFVPNGTAIDNFSRMPAGRKILNDPIRWRWLLRRLISRERIIYLDQINPGTPFRYTADNGEDVYIQITGRGGLPSGQTTMYVIFGNVKAEVIRSDIGASNGVIHIIDQVLFVQDDLYRDVSLATANQISLLMILLSVILSILLFHRQNV